MVVEASRLGVAAGVSITTKIEVGERNLDALVGDQIRSLSAEALRFRIVSAASRLENLHTFGSTTSKEDQIHVRWKTPATLRVQCTVILQAASRLPKAKVGTPRSFVQHCLRFIPRYHHASSLQCCDVNNPQHCRFF